MDVSVGTDDPTIIDEATTIIRRVETQSSRSIETIEPIAVESSQSDSGRALFRVEFVDDTQFVIEYDQSMVGASTLFEVTLQQVFRQDDSENNL